MRRRGLGKLVREEEGAEDGCMGLACPGGPLAAGCSVSALLFAWTSLALQALLMRSVCWGWVWGRWGHKRPFVSFVACATLNSYCAANPPRVPAPQHRGPTRRVGPVLLRCRKGTQSPFVG